jgi:hypothetical protein
MFLKADENFQGHVVGSSVVIYLGQYMHQSAWGQVWRLPEDEAPVRVKPTPVHNVNIEEALARGDLKGTGFELLAHTLAQRGCSSPSMMSPLLVVLTSNSAAFTGDQRALKDVDDELAPGCLEAFPTPRLGMIPFVTVRQSLVDKKLAAHLKAAGEEAKARRISNKSAGTEHGISSNGWTDMSKHMRLELVKLDQKLQGLVAMCAMATALNEKAIAEERESGAVWGVYMHQGDVNRAYRNFFSCPTSVWQSGLYVIRVNDAGVGKVQFLLDLALDFGGEPNPLFFAEPAAGAVQVLTKMIIDGASGAKVNMQAPDYTLAAMRATRPVGFSREFRLRTEEFRKFNNLPEQPVPGLELAVAKLKRKRRSEGSAIINDQSVRQTIAKRGVCKAAVSHPEVNESTDMFRASAYMDDFDIGLVDEPTKKRVRSTRQCLKSTGDEMKLPFGEAKWLEGEPAQDMVSLGIGFNVSDALDPRVYIPEESVTEVIFLMNKYVLQRDMLLKEAESLASKLLRMSMVVENGRLYICGLFALARLVGRKQAFARRSVLRHERKRKRGGDDDQCEVRVPVTKWAKRNMEWWLRYFENGCPKVRCIQQHVTFKGDIEADACGDGYGGFIIVGTTLYYFLGKWTEDEIRSFESKEP